MTQPIFESDESSFIEPADAPVPTLELTAEFAQNGHMWIDHLVPGIADKYVIILIRYNDTIVFSTDRGRHWIYEDAVLATGPHVKTLRRRFEATLPRWLNSQPEHVRATMRPKRDTYNWRSRKIRS